VARQAVVVPKLREWAMQAVTYEPARDVVKAGVRQGARARGRVLELTGRVPDLATIFLASSPKAGSQWSKAVFDHPVVRAKTGLLTLPQLDYQAYAPRKFPAGVLVPGLYVGYDHYRRIPKPHPYKTIYVFRDPRELIVSAYFSNVATHRIIGDLARIRAELRGMSVEDGLLHMTRLLGFRLREMDTWAGVEDPDVLVCKLEEIGADGPAHVSAMLDHCGIALTDEEFATVVDGTSRESLQRKDLETRSAGEESHYRVKRQGYRDLFDQRHYDLVEQIVPGLVERLGYPAAP